MLKKRGGDLLRKMINYYGIQALEKIEKRKKALILLS